MDFPHQTKTTRATANHFCQALFAILILLVTSASCLAANITLQWDQETAADLAGYRVYYSVDSPDLPFAGTGADQGASPVVLTTVNSATITGLDPERAHYFAVTAYNTSGAESPYSNVLAIPELVAPTVEITSPGNSTQVGGTVSINATASDNVEVTAVKFLVNGIAAATAAEAPYLFSWDTSALPSGSYTIAAEAVDAAGNVGKSSPVTLVVLKDAQVPVVSLSSPVNGATLSGTVAVSASATDDVAVSKVEIFQDATLVFAGNGNPVTYNWDTRAAVNGPHTLSAKAYDAAGNVGQSSIVTVNVLNDTTAPAVSITSSLTSGPAGAALTVSANASDDVAVTRVEFYVNGALSATSTSAPYAFSLNTALTAGGIYTLSAKAYDAAGNVGQSAELSVDLSRDTTAPTVSLIVPVKLGASGGTLALTASATDNVAVTRVEFYVDGALGATSTSAPYGFNWNSKTVANGSHTLSAKAYDAAGNVGQSAPVTVSIFNDTTAPAVAIVSPGNNSTAGRSLAVSASASDNVGVTRVEFFVNGALKATSTSAPYGFSWNSGTVANGAYTLSAKAYDAAGNVGQSANVVVNVFNDTTAPTVTAFSLPSTKNSTTVAVSALLATDNGAVAGYLITESATAPAASATGWSATAPTSFTFAGTGTRTAYAWAKDAVGNVSAGRSATVLIDTALPVIRSLTLSSASTGVTIKASATDNVAVTRMELYLDNTLQMQTSASSFTYVWAAVGKRSQTVTVKVYDAAGNLRSQSLRVSKY